MSEQPEEDNTPPRRTFSDLANTGRRVFYFLGAMFVLYVMATGPNTRNMVKKAVNSDPSATDTANASASPFGSPAAPEPEAKPDASEQIRALEERLHSMENESETVEPAAQESKDSAQRARLAELEEKLAQQSDKLEALSDQLAQFEQKRQASTRLIDEQNRSLASLSLLVQLRQALLRGDGFRSEVEALRELNNTNAKANAILVQLSGVATGGVYTLSHLQNDFRITLEYTLQQLAGNSFTANLKKLVRIRRVGEQQNGNDDESVMARAEAQLERGEVSTALKTLDALSPESKKLFSPWQKAARDYQSTLSAVEELQRLFSLGKHTSTPLADTEKAAGKPDTKADANELPPPAEIKNSQPEEPITATASTSVSKPATPVTIKNAND